MLIFSNKLYDIMVKALFQYRDENNTVFTLLEASGLSFTHQHQNKTQQIHKVITIFIYY